MCALYRCGRREGVGLDSCPAGVAQSARRTLAPPASAARFPEGLCISIYVADSDRFFTPAHVAAVLHKSIKTLANDRSAGRGPRSVKLGGKVLYPADDLEAWIAEQSALSARGGPQRRGVTDAT